MNSRMHDMYLAASAILEESSTDPMLKRLGSDQKLDGLQAGLSKVIRILAKAKYLRQDARAVGFRV